MSNERNIVQTHFHMQMDVQYESVMIACKLFIHTKVY